MGVSRGVAWCGAFHSISAPVMERHFIFLGPISGSNANFAEPLPHLGALHFTLCQQFSLEMWNIIINPKQDRPALKCRISSSLALGSITRQVRHNIEMRYVTCILQSSGSLPCSPPPNIIVISAIDFLLPKLHINTFPLQHIILSSLSLLKNCSKFSGSLRNWFRIEPEINLGARHAPL